MKEVNNHKSEFYAEETKELDPHRGLENLTKHKTYDEIFGEEKARERKKKLREYLKNHPEQHEKMIKNGHLTISLKTKGKTYEEIYGILKSKKIIEKKSKSSKNSWKLNPNQGTSGKCHSEKTKQKIREGRFKRKRELGYINSPETREKLSQRLKGVTGKNARNWQDGKSFEPYSIDWTESLKELTRERDTYTCQLCKKIQQEELISLGQKLSVHHIDYDKQNCHPDNLITLCHSCNVKVNSNRDYFTEFFRKLLKPRTFQKIPKWKELRCQGVNKRGRTCGQLLYKYSILENEVTVQIKCPSCNTYNILHVPFKKNDPNNKQSQ